MRPYLALIAVLSIVLMFALGLVACGPGGAPAAGGDNTIGQWSYVTGPHGENCLILSSSLGISNGWAAMDCDTVNP